MLNNEVFDKVGESGGKILVVTKYWDAEKTTSILASCNSFYSNIFFGLGENRTNILQEKNLSREKTHFIGNIQSREIKKIVQYCSTIHSLSNIKHAQKIENIGEKIDAFIQIRLDEHKSTGISEGEISSFLKACKDFKYLRVIGISGMGAADLDESSRRKEFRRLIHIRNTHIPNGLISAGTSRDYEIALEEGIDIVRVGQKAIIK